MAIYDYIHGNNLKILAKLHSAESNNIFHDDDVVIYLKATATTSG